MFQILLSHILFNPLKNYKPELLLNYYFFLTKE